MAVFSLSQKGNPPIWEAILWVKRCFSRTNHRYPDEMTSWYPENLPKSQHKKSFLCSLKLLCMRKPTKILVNPAEKLQNSPALWQQAANTEIPGFVLHLFGFSSAGMKNSLSRTEENTATEVMQTCTTVFSFKNSRSKGHLPGKHQALEKHCHVQNKGKAEGGRKQLVQGPHWTSSIL